MVSLSKIRESLKFLFSPEDVVELRIFHIRQGTISGYFDKLATLTEAASGWSGKAPAIYVYRLVQGGS